MASAVRGTSECTISWSLPPIGCVQLRHSGRSILLQGAKKGLHNLHRRVGDYAFGYVRRYGFLAIRGFVGVTVQLDNCSVQGDSSEQALGAGIRIDRGFQLYG